MKVIEILESGTIYCDVLTVLIDAFYAAVSTKKDNLKLQNQMKKMESRIVSLEKRLADDKDSPRKSARDSQRTNGKEAMEGKLSGRLRYSGNDFFRISSSKWNKNKNK